MQYAKKLISALRNANYGTYKIWTNRIRANLNFLQFLMITSIYISSATFEWWHSVILILFLWLSIYDNDKGFTQEIEYSNKRNKMFMEMYNKIMKE